MGKTRIIVDCIDQRLIVANDPLLASGGQNEDEIEFNFCPLWDGFGKTAVFYRTPDDVYHAAVSNNRSVIPAEVLTEKGEFYFGVFGSKGEAIRTSEVIKYSIVQGAMIPGTKPAEPTPDIYAQIMSAVGNIETRMPANGAAAFPATGGNMHGWIDFGNFTHGLRWVSADGTLWELRPYTDGNIFQLVISPPGKAGFGALTINADGTPNFAMALPVTSGGTGATDAAGARNAIEAAHYKDGIVRVTNQGGIGPGRNPGDYWALWNLSDDAGHYPAAFHPSQNGTQLLGTWEHRIKEVWANNYPCGTWNGDAIAVEKGGTGAADPATARNHLGAASEAEVKAHRCYFADGKVISSRGGTTEGIGRVTVNIASNGIARLDFVASVSTAGSAGDVYEVGIIVDVLRALNPSIPAMSPLTGGTLMYYSPEGQLIAGLQGYGGTFNSSNGMWCAGRIYNETDGCGQWADDSFTAGLKLVGTCYGYLV